MNKKALTERDICTQFITPAITRAGWDLQTQVREQVHFTKGRITEQKRIVAKVDELMALCDELETHLTETTTTRRQLLEATLAEALVGGF